MGRIEMETTLASLGQRRRSPASYWAESNVSQRRIAWSGDLDDDCTAHWCGMVLRAEWMDDDLWWWAVVDAETQSEIASSNVARYSGISYASGVAARDAAEFEARQHAQTLGLADE